jgi:hypothetical protein
MGMREGKAGIMRRSTHRIATDVALRDIVKTGSEAGIGLVVQGTVTVAGAVLDLHQTSHLIWPLRSIKKKQLARQTPRRAGYGFSDIESIAE